MTRRLLLDWKLTARSGWGNYGLHFADAALRHGYAVVPLLEPDPEGVPAPLRDRLAPVFGAWPEVARLYASLGPARGATLDGLRVAAFGNQFAQASLPSAVATDDEVGLIFFEDAALTPAALARAQRCRTIVTGSSWNARILRDAGLPSVHFVMQGVDTTVFRPGPRSDRFAGRFVVFSGGKLEYRKGQDIVVAAFRAFHRRHPEALLLHAWDNPWPATAATIGDGGHVDGPPATRDGRLDITPWLERHGIPAEAQVAVPPLPNAAMGAVVRHADVAVFPNRCEGGTNLVAMECMAAGIPLLLSANTGHLDLLRQVPAVALPSTPHDPAAAPDAAWGDVAVDAVVAALEDAWRDRAAARARATEAVAWMHRHDWPTQMDHVMARLTAADTRSISIPASRVGGR